MKVWIVGLLVALLVAGCGTSNNEQSAGGTPTAPLLDSGDDVTEEATTDIDDADLEDVGEAEDGGFSITIAGDLELTFDETSGVYTVAFEEASGISTPTPGEGQAGMYTLVFDDADKSHTLALRISSDIVPGTYPLGTDRELTETTREPEGTEEVTDANSSNTQSNQGVEGQDGQQGGGTNNTSEQSDTESTADAVEFAGPTIAAQLETTESDVSYNFLVGGTFTLETNADDGLMTGSFELELQNDDGSAEITVTGTFNNLPIPPSLPGQ